MFSEVEGLVNPTCLRGAQCAHTAVITLKTQENDFFRKKYKSKIRKYIYQYQKFDPIYHFI